MKLSYLSTLVLIISSLISSCQKGTNSISTNIIPKPDSILVNQGYFEINNKTKVDYSENSDVHFIAKFITEELSRYNLNPEASVINNETNHNNSIVLKLDENLEIGKEAYQINVTQNQLLIKAKEANGLFYGLQTIKQLLPIDFKEKIKIQCLEIIDEPRFSYRGMHLDVCRHFMPKEFILKYIDYLSAYKLNTFHWHLTEDQGWRIEIKKYPKLTEIGAWRKETVIGHAQNKPWKFDGEKHGGFYTQEDIKKIVAYASERFITIIPEIEMPGHAQAAIAAYPELGCTNENIDVWTSWGVSPYIYNVNDATFEFLENVLSEVIELFPGPYIHIGGDEAIKDQWKNSKAIQEKIKNLGLKDEHELQSYFIKRIEKFVNSKGKTIIGWDEILEGGLAPNAVVMSWRGTEGGIAAAKSKHNVIMTPGTHCYFDHYQSKDKNEPLAIGGFTSLEKVYSFNPVPLELNQEESKYILGAQANVWTEYIPDSKHVEYMIFPRMLALSEVLWTNSKKKNYTDFLYRINTHKLILDKQGINYAKHEFIVE